MSTIIQNTPGSSSE